MPAKRQKRNRKAMTTLWEEGATVTDLLRIAGSSLRRVAEECETSQQNVYQRLLIAGRDREEAIKRRHVPRTELSQHILETIAEHINIPVASMWPGLNGSIEKDN